jgi:hypothetical protein
MTIRDTEIYYVSGDALQTQDGVWQNVVVERSKFWNGPLPTARAGYPAGANPGENAIDTKEDNTVTRATMTVRDSTFYGWDSTYIFGAALNLKEFVDVVVDGNTFYDNNVALRLRGRPNDMGAHVTVINNISYGNVWAIRYEDDIQQLIVYNNTFDEGAAAGDGIIASPDYSPLTSGFLNNLFLLTGAKPPEAAGASNLAVTAAGFVDAAGHNYRLVDSSSAVGGGTDLLAAGVLADRWGIPRPQGAGFDVGAFELVVDGDVNLDGYVDLPDLIALARSWGATPAAWTQGDMNHDWTVDLVDLVILARNWNQGAPPASSAVPEPALIALLLAGASFLPARRRQGTPGRTTV